MATSMNNKTQDSSANTIKKVSNRNRNANNLAAENEALKQQMKDMQEQMQEMMSRLEAIAVSAPVPTYEVTQPVHTYIPPRNKDIEVVSLSTGHLLLSTNGRSDGRVYEFTRQFEKKFIPEEDLRLIVHAMPNTSSDGHFYIKDREFVEENGLRVPYNNMLDMDKLKHILNKNIREFETTYKLASKTQQETILEMVIDRLLYGKKVDANIVVSLEKLTGKRLMDIEPIEPEKEG